MTTMTRRKHSAGFTLIELMMTLVIMAIVITVGAPALADFVAAQRVRTAASDMMGDMSLARAEAIKESRRAILAPLTTDWKDGWQVCVDLNGDNSCQAAEVRKIGSPISGRTKMCATPAGAIVFRPDGRVMGVRGPGDGLRVSHDLDDSDPSNDQVRFIFLGLSGRPSMQIQEGGTVCP
jgi:type IV fimbrial biogenesis protein FimT